MKWIKYIIPIILVMLLILLVYKSCNIYDELSIWKGRADQAKKQVDFLTNKFDELLKENQRLVRKQEKIKNESNKEAEKALDAVGKLKAERKTKEEIKSQAENLQERVVLLEKELDRRDEIIQTLEFTIARKDEAYFALDKQYQISLENNRALEGVRQELIRAMAIKDKQIKVLESALKRRRFGGYVQKGIIIGLAGVVVYSLLK